MKTMRTFLQNIGLAFAPMLINLLCKTLKVIVLNEKVYNSFNSNFVLMFWHGKMIAPWFYNRNKNFFAVVSQSKDGEILSRVLKKWGYKLIRGSSSKDSKEVMSEMVASLTNGNCLAITPDGPRGPIYNMKIGGLISAVRSNTNIFLCGVCYRKKWMLKSWDKFEVPKPFSKVVLAFSNPHKIEAGLSNEEYNRINTNLECELISLEELAQNYNE
ncbi:MAG: lysophospholipid acyltransferase family protein [Ignavibacteria bacterium]|nr:lysophospholipid acyltransferase family protein [Ignavibacteria bacterium]